jgi:hypothetical protein
MDNLILLTIKKYSEFLTNLTWGKINQNYDLLYSAVLMIKNNIADEKYVQYINNNL